jgi:hypothetical protein
MYEKLASLNEGQHLPRSANRGEETSENVIKKSRGCSDDAVNMLLLSGSGHARERA